MAGASEVHTIAVTAEDVVAAYEHNQRTDVRAVLRMTPPFHGRMRARLHVEQDDDPPTGMPSPVHVPPARFVAEDDVPALPRAPDTREWTGDDYSQADHYDRHVDAMDAWRDDVAAAIVDELTIGTPTGDRAVDVTVFD